MKRSFLLLGFLVLASQPGCEGDGCDHANCDAQCKAHGFGWGTCEGGSCSCASNEICGDGVDNDGDGSTDCWDSDCGYGGPRENACADGLDNDCDGDVDCYDIGDCNDDPACGGCENATCNSDCRAAGWAGGSCVSAACQCSNGCVATSTCLSGDICYRGECKPPWGNSFTFVITEGEVPSGDWDTGSNPDPKACLYVDDVACCTGEATDNWFPVWNKECSFTVNSGSTWAVTLYEIDMAFDDTVHSWPETPITVDHFIAGGAVFSYLDGHVTVAIQW